MINTKKIILAISLISFTFSNSYAEKNYSIVRLVNEQVITNYDVNQRVKLYAILNRIDINSNNYPIIANTIIDKMTNELLKNEKIKEFNITIDNLELEYYLNQVYSQTQTEKVSFEESLAENLIKFETFKNTIINQISWQKLTTSLFVRQANVSDKEIDFFLEENLNVKRDSAKNTLMQKQIDLRALKYLRDLRNEATIETR